MLINTGWHRRYSDSKEYFGHAPGPEQGRRRVAGEEEASSSSASTPRSVDHPLATSLGPHRNGPQIKYLLPEYKQATGREAISRFPGVERRRTRRCSLPAFRPSRTSAAISTKLSASAARSRASRGNGTRATPASIRLVAMLDPDGQLSARSRARDRSRAVCAEASRTCPSSTDDCSSIDLTTAGATACRNGRRAPNLNVRVLEFHAKDGLLVQQFEGIMHRGTHMDAPIHVQENTPTLTGYPLWRFFGTGVAVSIPKRQMGRHHAEGSRKRRAENPEERHRHDQHRQPPQLRRQPRLLRLFARASTRKRPNGSSSAA